MELDLYESPHLDQKPNHPDNPNRGNVWLEFFLCIIIVAGTLTAALWPLLAASNATFPYTGDGLGHLTKVKYMADCLKHLEWPAWFPVWYSGSTTFQYYPPLSFFLLVPVQILFNNILITFKFWVFASCFIGALGVWYIGYHWLGRWFGIVGAVLYAIQPFLLRSMLMQGVIAQGPIIALSPFLLLATLLFFEKQTAWRWISITVLIGALILSHAMHAFIICLAMLYLVILLLIMRKIDFKDFFLWGWAIVVGAGLVAFWWLPGVTHLEMAGLPFTYGTGVQETVYTAGLDWFNPAIRKTALVYYFSPSILIFALLTVLFLNKRKSTPADHLGSDSRERKLSTNDLILCLLFALLGTMALAFGHKIPGYNYIPMSQFFFPGRILTFSSLLATLLCTILISQIIKKGNTSFKKVIAYALVTVIIVIIMLDENPRYAEMQTLSYKNVTSAFEKLPSKHHPFEQGRFGAVCPMGTESTYFPIIYGWNTTIGWNLEGSIHTYTLLRDNVALVCDHSDYTIKNLLHWNTRAVVIGHQYPDLRSKIEHYGFKEIARGVGNSLYYSQAPSNYFMRSNWDAIVIGRSAPGLEINYPWMVEGHSDYLEDYPSAYLDIFKLVYLVDPQIRDYNKFQEMIQQLSSHGHLVVIEMGRLETRPLLDVYPYLISVEPGSKLITTPKSPFQQQLLLPPNFFSQVAVMGNLDGVLMEMEGSGQKAPAIGYKNIGGHKVYFVGMALSQQLESAIKWEEGIEARSSIDRETSNLLEQLMNLAHLNKSIVPVSFPVQNAKWRHDGVSFGYDSKQSCPIQVSVTYTPRWRATIDGKPWPVYNTENLILLKLPAGQHQVNIKYGLSWVGWVGIAVSAISLLIMLLCAFQLDRFIRWCRNLGRSLLLNITDSE